MITLFIHTAAARFTKRDLATGTLITSVNLPEDRAQTTLGSVVVRNSGLDVDECGNVTQDRVTGLLNLTPTEYSFTNHH
jgi:hypothetical protein